MVPRPRVRSGSHIAFLEWKRRSGLTLVRVAGILPIDPVRLEAVDVSCRKD